MFIFQSEQVPVIKLYRFKMLSENIAEIIEFNIFCKLSTAFHVYF